jgi:hypothetical protein
MQTPACGPSVSSSELAFFASLRSELVSLRVGLCVFPSKEDGKPPASDSSQEDGKPPASDSVLPSKEDGTPRHIARSKVTSMYGNVAGGGKIIYTKTVHTVRARRDQKLQADPYSYCAVLGKLRSLSNPTTKDLLGNFRKEEIMLLLQENRIATIHKGSRKRKTKVSRLICPSLRLICLSFRLICLSFRRRWPPICWS